VSLCRGLALSSLHACYLLPHLSRFLFFFFFGGSFERMLFSNSGVSLLLLLKHLG
jgi:hypothetical protein